MIITNSPSNETIKLLRLAKQSCEELMGLLLYRRKVCGYSLFSKLAVDEFATCLQLWGIWHERCDFVEPDTVNGDPV